MDIAFKHAASKTMYLKNASKESIVNFKFANLLQVIEKLTVLCDSKFKRYVGVVSPLARNQQSIDAGKKHSTVLYSKKPQEKHLPRSSRCSVGFTYFFNRILFQ